MLTGSLATGFYACECLRLSQRWRCGHRNDGVWALQLTLLMPAAAFDPGPESDEVRAREVRLLGEWAWWITSRGDALHAADVPYDPTYDTGGTGTTSCGRRTLLFIPGLFERMGLSRCKQCCRKLGYPTGTGSPKNDAGCRALVEARLAELCEAATLPAQ